MANGHPNGKATRISSRRQQLTHNYNPRVLHLVWTPNLILFRAKNYFVHTKEVIRAGLKTLYRCYFIFVSWLTESPDFRWSCSLEDILVLKNWALCLRALNQGGICMNLVFMLEHRTFQFPVCFAVLSSTLIPHLGKYHLSGSRSKQMPSAEH